MEFVELFSMSCSSSWTAGSDMLEAFARHTQAMIGGHEWLMEHEITAQSHTNLVVLPWQRA
jgi:hypothetical protein